jgi:hypothetical protein
MKIFSNIVVVEKIQNGESKVTMREDDVCMPYTKRLTHLEVVLFHRTR